MFELRIKRGDFEDLVKKMSLPAGKNPNRKDEFVFEVIAPKITPDGYLEWIGKTKDITSWIRAKGLEVSGINVPIVIAFNSKEIMNMFKFFKEENDVITITHNTDTGEDIFTVDNNKRK